MVNFIPIPGVEYKHDYEAIFRDIAAGKLERTKTYRELCKTDLFFLLYFGLERVDVNEVPKGKEKDFVIKAIREVETDHTNTLDLWAREHYKSTIITYGLPIQELLNNQEERIAIFSHTRPIAKGFLRQIKLTLEGSVPVKKWFPDIYYSKPKTQAPKWSEDDGLIVKRKGHPKESSIEAWGLVDGQPTSKHFTIRVYDDIVTKESVTTPEQLKKVLDAYELSESLGTDGGSKRIAGTHYHFGDLYTHLKKKDNYKLRFKPATDDGTEEGAPVFLSQERLDELKREQGPYIFSCQQLLNPIAAGEQKFETPWLRHYKELPADRNKYILVDPANEQHKKSDFTVMAVVSVDQYKNRYLEDLLRDRLNLGQRWAALRDMYGRHPDVLSIGYEKYGMQSDDFYFKERQETEGIYLPRIIDLGGRTGKWDRIYRLVPKFKNGQFLLPYRLYYTTLDGEELDMIQVFLDEEYRVAPFCLHDDIFDCLARIEDKKLNITYPAGIEANKPPPINPELVYAANSWMAG